MADSYEEKRLQSAEHFRAAVSQQIEETTPPFITDEIAAFAQTLGPVVPQYIPVVHDPLGLFGWCSDGVLEKIKRDGGSISFGWCFWHWRAAFLTAEFHAVWVDKAGIKIDITPKPQGQETILFAPDANYAPDFNFDKRPTSRRKRTYQAEDMSELAETQIAQMKPTQRAYEQRRADKAGLSLKQWMLHKTPVDPLPQLIDDFIQVCDQHDELLDSIPGTGTVKVPRSYIAIAEKKLRLLRQLQQAAPKN